ncbi:sulfotransferase [Thiomicrorhabdus sp.]|uniref:sulfotransferase family protein n=1 Tax=Thiomicrorhabdus sp. TaxID=2039724 RepID=UPI002AA8BCC5|nr:sulfotransferase [Thiomicrorhabdus sp.]
MKSPIFLFSLPRSGSTLLQRVLMSHSEIASVAEPWIMLPFSYAYKPNGVLTEYSHNVSFSAIEDFIDNLPNKEGDYYEAVGEFASTLYRKQCKNNELYFLDKTPRYYLIIPEILKVFPDAKFIFLFRNPIHVMSSMMQTWSNGGFNKMYAYDTDLNEGPKLLSEGYQVLGGNAFGIQYEKFVEDPTFYTSEICKYLDLSFEEEMLKDFSIQNTGGRMGDPTGVKVYNTVSKDSLQKWKITFSTRLRRKIAFDYLSSIDESVLKIQGYTKLELLDEVEKINIKCKLKLSIVDGIHLLYLFLVRKLKANIFFAKKLKSWTRTKYLS